MKYIKIFENTKLPQLDKEIINVFNVIVPNYINKNIADWSYEIKG